MEGLPHSALATRMVNERVVARGAPLAQYRLVFDTSSDHLSRTFVILMVPMFAAATFLPYRRALLGFGSHVVFAVRRIAGEARWIAAVKAVLLTVVATVVLQVYRLICSCSRSIPCEAAWARQRRRACARRPCPPGIFLADSAISSPKRPWRPCTWHPSLRSRFADARRRMQRRRESRAMAP